MTSGIIEYLPNMVIGHGWDPSLNLQRRQMIDADTTEETMTGTGQVIRFELSVKESVDEVLNTLDLSADASYSSTGFSAGISAEYLKSQKTSRLYTYVLATVKVQNPPRNLTNIALLAGAQRRPQHATGRFLSNIWHTRAHWHS